MVVDGRQGSLDAALANKATQQTRIASALPAQKASAEAALAQAQVELDKTLVTAGVDGMVQQFTLRPGDVVNPIIRTGGILVPDASREGLIAGFGQIEAQVMKVGMIAEATCIARPFTILPMVVSEVQTVIAAGQIRPTDQLIDVQSMAQPGTITVFLEPLYAGRADRRAAGQQLHRQRLHQQPRRARGPEHRHRPVALPARRRHRRSGACDDPQDAGDAAAGADPRARRPLIAPIAPSRHWLAPGLRGYRWEWLRGDIPAGLAVAAVNLPIAIAYPAIAGLPPETGIYASIAPLVAYALLGPSQKLIVGPDAATMTVLAAVLAAVTATAAGADRVAVAALLALAVGALCLLARALRLGVLASFLSRPILTGFFIGISLSILVGQIGRFTGVQIEADGLIRPFVELARKAGSIHWPSVALAFAMLAVLQGVKAARFPVPGPLVVVVLAVLLSAAFDFRGHGIAVVGDIPTRLPSFAIPSPGGLPLDTVLLGACAIFAVAFSSGIVTARSFGAREGTEVEPDRELIGFGAANLAAGCFGGFPVTAASSRTAVNIAAGGRSQLAAIVAAMALTATLVFLGSVLRILPVPALGAILVAAALGMIQVGALREIWRISRMEFAFALIAMWGPIGLGVLNGVVIAIGATLFYLLRKMMYPRYAMLGRIPGRGGFYKLHRNPEARPVPGLAICLIQGSLLFFNSDTMRARLRAFAADLPPDTRWLVLDAGAIVQVDSTAAAMLDELRAELAAQGIALGLADLHFDVRALLDRAGVTGRIGPDMIFNGLDGALRAFEATARGGQDHGEEPKSPAEAAVGRP